MVNIPIKTREEEMEDTYNLLVKIQHEDRLSIYSMLEMLIGYINGYEFSEDILQKQKIIIDNIAYRYEISSMDDLKKLTDEAVKGLREYKLYTMKPLGSVQ